MKIIYLRILVKTRLGFDTFFINFFNSLITKVAFEFRILKAKTLSNETLETKFHICNVCLFIDSKIVPGGSGPQSQLPENVVDPFAVTYLDDFRAYYWGQQTQTTFMRLSLCTKCRIFFPPINTTFQLFERT